MNTTLDTFFPKILADLYMPDGIEYRIEYNQKIWGFIFQHQNRDNLTPYEKEYIGTLRSMPERNILVPCKEFLNDIEAPFDIIAVSFKYMPKEGTAKNVVLMEYYSPQSPIQEGSGKTGLALMLSGVDIPYDEIPHPQSRNDSNDVYKAIAELDKKPITSLPSKKKNVKLITSDLTYIGIGKDGKLYIAPALAEPFIAQWDTARHTSRLYNAYYKDESGRTIQWLKEYLLKLAEKYYLGFGDNGMFNDPFSYKGLDEIYIIQQEPKRGNATIEIIPETEAKKVLESLLLRNPISHPAYPESAFWRLNEDDHKRRVQHISDNLTTVPRIWTLNLLPNDARTHLQDAAEVLEEMLEKHE